MSSRENLLEWRPEGHHRNILPKVHQFYREGASSRRISRTLAPAVRFGCLARTRSCQYHN